MSDRRNNTKNTRKNALIFSPKRIIIACELAVEHIAPAHANHSQSGEGFLFFKTFLPPAHASRVQTGLRGPSINCMVAAVVIVCPYMLEGRREEVCVGNRGGGGRRTNRQNPVSCFRIQGPRSEIRRHIVHYIFAEPALCALKYPHAKCDC